MYHISTWHQHKNTISDIFHILLCAMYLKSAFYTHSMVQFGLSMLSVLVNTWHIMFLSRVLSSPLKCTSSTWVTKQPPQLSCKDGTSGAWPCLTQPWGDNPITCLNKKMKEPSNCYLFSLASDCNKEQAIGWAL